MPVGYGSLIVADEHGRYLDNPPLVPREAYFYLIFSDQLAAGTNGVGTCAGVNCMGIARARYEDVIRAALSDDPHRVAKLFHKFGGSFPGTWEQPATSDTPDLSGMAGSFAPLWTDGGAYQGSVIYDRVSVRRDLYEGIEGLDPLDRDHRRDPPSNHARCHLPLPDPHWRNRRPHRCWPGASRLFQLFSGQCLSRLVPGEFRVRAVGADQFRASGAWLCRRGPIDESLSHAVGEDGLALCQAPESDPRY